MASTRGKCQFVVDSTYVKWNITHPLNFEMPASYQHGNSPPLDMFPHHYQ